MEHAVKNHRGHLRAEENTIYSIIKEHTGKGSTSRVSNI